MAAINISSTRQAPSAPASVTPSIAPCYGAAGWTGARGHVNSPVGDDDATFSGWTVGAGLDYAFSNNIFGRVEYRYDDYGSKDLLGVDSDFNQNVVTLGVCFKF